MANDLYTVADFIKDYWIGQVSTFYKTNDFVSFFLIGIGIEFLGRCLDKPESWDKGEGQSRQRFNKAINTFGALARYKPFLFENHYGCVKERIQGLCNEVKGLKNREPGLKDIDDVVKKLEECNEAATGYDWDLYSVLRCGLVHEGLPKKGLVLANGYSTDHLTEKPDGLFVDIAELSKDFKGACEELLNKTQGKDSDAKTNLTRKCIKVHTQGVAPKGSGGKTELPIATGDPSTCPLSKQCSSYQTKAYETFCEEPKAKSFTATKDV